MPKKAAAKSARKGAGGTKAENTEPKYPYTQTPSALRKFLKLVPEKPKPAKINQTLLKSWGMADTNAGTIIRVLKRMDLVSATNDPTPNYETFMQAKTGPPLLGRKMREIYPELFNASKTPHKEDDASLRRLFNIHAGGSEKAIQLQMQTFKALADHATFDSPEPVEGIAGVSAGVHRREQTGSASGQSTIHIDLHIHLPPDKSSRDYQAMFEDIGKYLLGQQTEKKDV